MDRGEIDNPDEGANEAEDAGGRLARAVEVRARLLRTEEEAGRLRATLGQLLLSLVDRDGLPVRTVARRIGYASDNSIRRFLSRARTGATGGAR
jgi:hypothetical protein